MILGLLKERTLRLHERIERTVDLPARLDSVGRYAALLARFHGYYAPLEERLAGAGLAAAGVDLGARCKAELLRADLAALGAGADAIGALPRCPDLPAVAGAADGLGCLYVLEGATLGGQVARREVERRLGLVPGRGCSFFGSYGERVGPMWREFCRALEGYAAAAPGAADRIVGAACATFAGLDRWVAEGAAW